MRELIIIFLMLLVFYYRKKKITYEIKIYYQEAVKISNEFSLSIDEFGNLEVTFNNKYTKIIRNSGKKIGDDLKVDIRALNYTDFVIEKKFTRYKIILGR